MSSETIINEIKSLIESIKERIENNNYDWNNIIIPPNSNDPSIDIDTDITIESINDKLTNYWNESVKKLLNKINGEIPIEDSEENISKNHDAAFSFTKEPYVSPDPNLKNEKYLDARTDEITEVLENSDNLDYTINKNKTDTASKLNDYITRLLMPQYARRVEVEDLNRNFWVIGQNLSFLNNLLLNEEYSPWKGMIQEIIDLWENVYAIWQAILYLSDKIDDIEDQLSDIAEQAAKTKIQLAYGWSWGKDKDHWLDGYQFDAVDKDQTILSNRILSYEKGEGTYDDPYVFSIAESVELRDSDVKYLGILPHIKKENLYKEDTVIGHICYLPYNKTITDERLNSMDDATLEDRFVNKYEEGEIIHVERTFGNRSIREILKAAQIRNFVLVSVNEEAAVPILDSLQSIINPYLSILQFYRDFIYNIYGNNLQAYIGNNEWILQQAAYIEYLQFEDINYNLSETDKIPQKIKQSIKRLYDKTEQENYLYMLLADASIITIQDLINKINDEYGIQSIIEHFYILYEHFSNKYNLFEVENDIEVVKELDNYIIPYFTDPHGTVYGLNTENIDENNIEKYCNYYRQQIQNMKGTIPDVSVVINPLYLFAGLPESYFCTDITNVTPSDCVIKTDRGDKYCKFLVDSDTHLQVLQTANRNVNWDLLSTLVFPDNFDNTDKKELYHKYLKPDEKVDSFASVIQDVLVQGGWWKEGVPALGGNSYMYPRNNDLCKGFWFDFINDPRNGKLPFLNTSIRSLTMNEYSYYGYIGGEIDMSCNQTVWPAHHYYNTDITIPFNNVDNVSYWDFLRLGKPYPSLIKLLEARENSIDYYSALNNQENYLGYASEADEIRGKNYCIDGFYGFDTFENYPETTTLIDKRYKMDAITKEEFILKTNAYREHENNKENHYFGSIYRNCVPYEISSTDLVNAHIIGGDVKEGYTRITNTNLVTHPAITIQYLNGVTHTQQIDIINSKDTTQGDWIVHRTPPPSPVPTYAEYKILSVGAFYPTDVNYLKKLKRTNSIEQADHFDEITYGLNSFGVHQGDVTQTISSTELAFIWYNEDRINYFKNSNNLNISDLHMSVEHGDFGDDNNNPQIMIYLEDFYSESEDQIKYLDNYLLEQLSIATIKNYYNKIESNIEEYVLTKFAISYWKGDSSSQWVNSFIEGAYKVTKRDGTLNIIKICDVFRADGYWDYNLNNKTEAVFSRPDNNSDAARWRNLRVYNPINTTSTGLLLWLDYNKTDTSTNPQLNVDGINNRIVAYADFNISGEKEMELSNSKYRLKGENNFIDDKTNEIIFPKQLENSSGTINAFPSLEDKPLAGNDSITRTFAKTSTNL